MVLTLPATAALLVLAEPIIVVLFQRGAFDAAVSTATAAALVATTATRDARFNMKPSRPAGYLAAVGWPVNRLPQPRNKTGRTDPVRPVLNSLQKAYQPPASAPCLRARLSSAERASVSPPVLPPAAAFGRSPS